MGDWFLGERPPMFGLPHVWREGADRPEACTCVRCGVSLTAASHFRWLYCDGVRARGEDAGQLTLTEQFA